MLIQVKSKDAIAIPFLFRLVLKSIFDSDNLKPGEEAQIRDSVVNWKNHLDLKKDIGMDAIDEENLFGLQIIATLLKGEEEGKFEKRKETFKRHKIDYKKFYRLPESYKMADFYRGQDILKEHMRTNPEDYQ